MKKNILSLLFLFLFTQNSYTQRLCLFYKQLKTSELIDPLLKTKRDRFENDFITWKEDTRSGKIKLPDTIFIPVVVHVLWHTAQENIIDAQIISQIKILNEDFNSRNADTANTPAYFKPLKGKTNFYFVLAKQDPDGMPTTGINRKYTFIEKGFGLDGSVNFTNRGGQDAWNPRYYVNIWCCKMEDVSGTFASTYFPGGSLLRDGIQCDYHYMGSGGITQPPYNLGRTITHEMGHYFNLDHVWGPSDITFISYCGDDDHVEDTPPQSKANYYCPSFPKSSCANYSDMFMDYMDYTDDPCMNMFSKGQAERMLAAYYIMTPNLKFSKALQQPKIFADDAGIKSILRPTKNSFVCDNKTEAKIVIRNYGTDSLKYVILKYGITNGDINTAVFDNINIAPFSNDTVVINFNFTGTGSLEFFASASMPNKKEDLQASNNAATTVFNANNGVGKPLPFSEDFSQVLFPPKGWSVLNSDELFTWTATTGSQLSGYAPSAMMDNIECPYKGRKDFLIMPPLDFSNTVKPQLLFDHAFQLYKNGRKVSDTLEIKISIDCGQNWQIIYYKGGKDLATVKPAQYGYLSPDKKSDFKKDSIDLSFYTTNNNVLIAFVNISGRENLLYLDNVEVMDAQNISANNNEPLHKKINTVIIPSAVQ